MRLRPFDDDPPLVRSLRAPGTPSELSDQELYVAMFRDSRGGGKVTPLAPGSPRPPRRAWPRRLGAGTTLSIALAVAGGGAAAAYTGSLPEPLQHFAHHARSGRPAGAHGAPPPRQGPPDRGAHAQRHPHADPHSDTHPDAHSVADPVAPSGPVTEADADPDANTDSHACSCTDRGSHAHIDPDPHADSHAQPDSQPDPRAAGAAQPR